MRGRGVLRQLDVRVRWAKGGGNEHGGVTNRKCTCAHANAELAILAQLYTFFNTRFSTHDSP